MSRLLQVYEHDALRVTFDARRCIHSAECIRHLPNVFDSAARPWIRPERALAEEIISAVHRCPTGALRVELHQELVDIADDDVSVRAVRNGPLYVRGAARVATEDGEVLLEDRRFALCRCGNSGRKPFCDGTHRKSGFRDPI